MIRYAREIIAGAIILTVAGCNAGGIAPNVSQPARIASGIQARHSFSSSPVFSVLHTFDGAPSDGYVAQGLIVDSSGDMFGATVYGGAKHPYDCTIGCGTIYKVSATGDTVLYSFKAASGGAFLPSGQLVAHNGVLYGTTGAGGTANHGTIFQLTPSSHNPAKWIETVIYNFQGPPHDGDDAEGLSIVDASGALYGTTFMGGSGTNCLFASNGCGTVFKLSPPASSKGTWTESVLHSFRGNPDGAAPGPDLVRSGNGALYGTTEYGGTSTRCPSVHGCGTLYRLDGLGNTSTSTTIHSFNVNSSQSDGSLPSGALITDAHGTLYGTTQYGGGLGNCNVSKGLDYCGTIYAFARASHKSKRLVESILYAFRGAPNDGSLPDELVMTAGGSFYGETVYGGSGDCQAGGGCGTIYELARATGKTSWSETTLHGFDYTDGAFPGGPLVLQNGVLYGTASYGGTGPCSFGCGTIYEVLNVGSNAQ